VENALRHGVHEQRMMMNDVPGIRGLRDPAAPARRLASDPILEHAGNLPRQRRAVNILLGLFLKKTNFFS
jgi:hypothetical protein